MASPALRSSRSSRSQPVKLDVKDEEEEEEEEEQEEEEDDEENASTYALSFAVDAIHM